MIRNKRPTAPTNIGGALLARFPEGVTVAWSVTADDGTDVPGGGDFDGLELPDGTLVVSTTYRRVPTEEEVTEAQLEAARAARVAGWRTELRGALPALKAGTSTEQERQRAIWLLAMEQLAERDE